MFEVGDHVVSMANGICEIKDVVEMEMSGSRKEYFLLIPESEANSKVYVPVDSAEKRIRKAMDKKSALSVIEQISDMEELIITNEKERETRYKEAVRSCDPKLLVGIIKNMYIRKQQRLAEGKKCTAMDEKYFGSTPILVDKGQKGRGTASCNLPATRYIIEANPLNVLKPRAFRFAACIMELIPSQTAFVMRW